MASLLFFLYLDLHQPDILFHVVGGRRRHDVWLNRSDRKTTRKENKICLHDTVVNRLRGYIKILFILGNTQTEEKGSLEGSLGRACLGPIRITLLVVSYFTNF